MAVKIRLKRMGQKKLLSIESLFQIPDHQEMVDSSKKLVLMIQLRILVYSTLTKK